MLLSIRVITYLFPSLLNLRQFELFDPTIYGSNIVQRSLGDLLFNSIFFCWFVLFAWSKVQHMELIGISLPAWFRWVAGIVCLCLLIYSTFILSSVIRSIVADSKISFDVTDFSSLTKYTAIAFFVLACLSLSYYYFTQLLFRVIFPLFKENTWPIYFAIGFAGLVYLTARSGDPAVLFLYTGIAWLLLYTWLVNRRGLILLQHSYQYCGNTVLDFCILCLDFPLCWREPDGGVGQKIVCGETGGIRQILPARKVLNFQCIY
jgi:hypothetical protein